MQKNLLSLWRKIYLSPNCSEQSCPNVRTNILTLFFQNVTVNRSGYKRCNSALSFLTSLFAWINTEMSVSVSQQNAPSFLLAREWTGHRTGNFSKHHHHSETQGKRRGEENLLVSLKYSVMAWLDKLIMTLIKVCLFSSLSYKKWITIGITFGLVPMQYLPKWIWWMKWF